MMPDISKEISAKAIEANYALAAELLAQAARDFSTAAEHARAGDNSAAVSIALNTISNIETACILHNAAMQV